MTSTRHEWVVAAEKDNVVKLQELKDQGDYSAQSVKVRDGFVAACGKNCLKAVDFFLKWGTPMTSPDVDNRYPLHTAAAYSCIDAIHMLCERKVDLELKDQYGCTALKMSIQDKHMDSAKALLLWDAKLPGDVSAPGLAACIREVQVEKASMKLKAISKTPEVTNEMLAAVDAGVWNSLREHQRLLRLREEQRAGKMLHRYEEKRKEELAAAERNKSLESGNSSDIKAKRVELLAKRDELNSLLRELEAHRGEESKLASEDEKLKAEVRSWRQELKASQDEVTAREALLQGEQDELLAAEARQQRLKDEITEQREHNKLEVEALELAKRELRGWHEDREAAALLSAKAHQLLGN